MTQPHICCYALTLGMLASASGGEDTTDYIEEPVVLEETGAPGEPDAFKYFKPSIDLLTRYEFREQENLDASHALTTRARIGLTLGEFNGFSAFGEVEATAAIVDDYHGGGATLNPSDPTRTAITDPENMEVNRFWLQYKKDGILAKVGRQRIIRNNAAFIGNVGWRQNEQTYDAAQLAYTADNFSISYAYADRVQRIFGRDGNNSPLEKFDGNFHFIDASFTADFGKVGAYAYLIDVDPNGGPTPNVGESNTYGIFTDIGGLHAEFAFQEGTSLMAGGDYDAAYGHVTYTQKLGSTSLTAGVEYLGENFKTPLATVHAFNGFADAFIAQRIGLNNAGGNYTGLTDVYLGITQPNLPGGITFKAFLHYFADDSLDETYGYEADVVLVKKFSNNITGLIKAAYFIGEGNGPYDNDITQVSAQIGYKF